MVKALHQTEPLTIADPFYDHRMMYLGGSAQEGVAIKRRSDKIIPNLTKAEHLSSGAKAIYNTG